MELRSPLHSLSAQDVQKAKCLPSSHPPSDTRLHNPLTDTFGLKKLSVVSYHKYKYFIVFLDDYTGFAWVTLLRDKGSAITALKAVARVNRNQYNTTIKEWMSDAGGEYKSDAFLRTLKDGRHYSATECALCVNKKMDALSASCAL